MKALILSMLMFFTFALPMRVVTAGDVCDAKYDYDRSEKEDVACLQQYRSAVTQIQSRYGADFIAPYLGQPINPHKPVSYQPINPHKPVFYQPINPHTPVYYQPINPH